MMEIRYFANFREAIGKASETYQGDATTIEDLVHDLVSRGAEYEVLQTPSLRVAIDHQMVDEAQASIAGVKTVALFPPVTGG